MTMSVRGKLWCAFGALLLILLAVSALSFAVLTLYSRALERVFHENYRSAVYSNEMKGALDRLNSRLERQLWGDPAAGLIDPSVEQQRFERNLNSQLDNCTLPGESQISHHADELWREYKSRYAAFHPGEAAGVLYRNDLLPRYIELKETSQRIGDMNMSNMVSVDGQAKRNLIDVRNTVLILAVVGASLAAALVAAVGAKILNPLGALTRSAGEIASGNLDLSIDVRSRDEIGQLIDAFNSMAVRLREFRKLDHDRLLRIQQTTQLAIDSLPDAVFVVSPDGRVEVANRTARKHFAIEPGKAVSELALPWLNEIYESVVVGLHAYEPANYKSAIRLFYDGAERYMLPHAVPMLDDEGRPVGATVVLGDVTRLRHEDELKTGMLSTVSHELRTPLTSIRMAVMLLLEEKFGGLTQGQQRLLAAASTDGDRLYGIIEDLLNLSRIEAGREQLQPVQITVKKFVAMSLDPLRKAIADKRLRLAEHVNDAQCLIVADPVRAGLALTNLLSNAMKFTPAGGTVDVAARLEGGFVIFCVSDTGPGIPPEYASRVFDKFFRIPRSDGPTGAGLGLAIAKEVVEAHGGRIEFQPRDGGGSTFRFTLPCASTPVPSCN